VVHKRNEAHAVYVCPRDISFNTASGNNLAYKLGYFYGLNYW